MHSHAPSVLALPCARPSYGSPSDQEGSERQGGPGLHLPPHVRRERCGAQEPDELISFCENGSLALFAITKSFLVELHHLSAAKTRLFLNINVHPVVDMYDVIKASSIRQYIEVPLTFLDISYWCCALHFGIYGRTHPSSKHLSRLGSREGRWVIEVNSRHYMAQTRQGYTYNHTLLSV